MKTCTVTVDEVRDVSGFAALRKEWTELHEASGSRNIFLTWEWLFSWWQHLGADRELNLLLVRRDGILLAIAPLAIRPRRPRRLLPFRALEFLGTGTAGSDYLDIIMRQGEESLATKALAQYLMDRNLVIELSHVSDEASNVSVLADSLVASGWIHSLSTMETCPFIPLQGIDWKSYLAGLGPAHRYNIRRRFRNIDKLFTMVFANTVTDMDRQRYLQLLASLHNKRWLNRGGSNALPCREMIDFHDTWSRYAMERGWLRLNVMWLDGRPAAALYGFMYRNRFFFYQSGFDPVFHKYSVGLVMMAETIRSAIAEGAVEYDLLHGDETYKFLWARDVRKLVCHNLYPPGMHGRFYRQAVGFRNGLRSVIGSSARESGSSEAC